MGKEVREKCRAAQFRSVTVGLKTRGEVELELRGYHALPAPEIYTTEYFQPTHFSVTQ